MKGFFKKIGAPFVAVGRWIKETAWVQPLLIVGVIFAIIFCIPSITNAIKEAMATDDLDWYAAQQISLEGTYSHESEANSFFDAYSVAASYWENGDYDDARETMKKYSSQGRFMLYFVQSDCSGCEEVQEASEYLVENWSSLIGGSSSSATDYPSFSYKSIICDQEIEDDDRYSKIKAFDYLYGDGNYYDFINDCQYAGTTSNYYRYGSNSSTIKSNLESLVGSDTSSSNLSSNFQTPMIVEFDLREERENDSSDSFISTVLYSYEGDDVYERSSFLVKLWKRTEMFSNNGKD